MTEEPDAYSRINDEQRKIVDAMVEAQIRAVKANAEQQGMPVPVDEKVFAASMKERHAQGVLEHGDRYIAQLGAAIGELTRNAAYMKQTGKSWTDRDGFERWVNKQEEKNFFALLSEPLQTIVKSIVDLQRLAAQAQGALPSFRQQQQWRNDLASHVLHRDPQEAESYLRAQFTEYTKMIRANPPSTPTDEPAKEWWIKRILGSWRQGGNNDNRSLS